MRARLIPYGLLLLLAALLAAWAAWLMLPKGQPGLSFKPVAYSALPGWAGDDLSDFDTALQRSCQAVQKMPDSRPLRPASIGGTAGDWKPVCTALEGLTGPALKTAIEAYLMPLSIRMSGSDKGLFTGYYEPLLEGSETPDPAYPVPLYARPADLVDLNLGLFRASLKGERIAGRLKGMRLVPFDDRRAIEAGSLSKRGEQPLLWVKDKISAFFLHIQGSGRVQLPDGRMVGVGYAAQNGHPYVAIGRILIREGHATADEMSLQFIRRWLQAHPDEADRIMQANPSYIFFRRLEDTGGPYGSAGVVLTAERSLAVDRRFLPMHTPIFLAASHPDPDDPARSVPFNRLLMAQDTGGAIRGELRGDLFFGPGEAAELKAGYMKAGGTYFILLPRSLAARVTGQTN